jgi:hypothetical protein
VQAALKFLFPIGIYQLLPSRTLAILSHAIADAISEGETQNQLKK